MIKVSRTAIPVAERRAGEKGAEEVMYQGRTDRLRRTVTGQKAGV
jgi:hypothetical protein